MPARSNRRRRPALLSGLGVAAAVILGLSVAPPVRAEAFGQFYANFAGEELMRAMNADRVALGLPRLRTDRDLENVARDQALACPSKPSLIIRGRARDMAERNYLSHAIPGCQDGTGGSFTAFELLQGFGYTDTAAGEVIASNDYPSSRVTYKTGCAVGGSGCHGSIQLPWTVAVAERSFMNSTGHRAIILSQRYGRFGCGAWESSSGSNYFSCYFVRHGNGTLDREGPRITSVSGVGATFRLGSTQTFTATAADALSVLSDGHVALDGLRIKRWAWDHAGTSASLSVTVTMLSTGTHTLRWWVRDASTRSRSLSFQFTVTR